MTDIFQEVEEEHRSERLVSGIQRWWPYGLGAVALLLAAVYGAQQWSAQASAARQAFSDRFVEAQNLVAAGQFDKAQTDLDALLKDAPESYIAPIHMERAAAFLAQSKTAEALEALTAATATSEDPLLEDLARLKASYVALSNNEAAPALKARLQPIIDRGGGLGLMAREIVGLSALKASDLPAAKEQFEYISIQLDSPPNLRQRAQTMLALLERQTAAAAPPAAPAAPSQNAEPAGSTAP